MRNTESEFVKNPVIPATVLSPPGGHTVKGKLTLQPSLLSPAVDPGRELCRAWGLVSMFLPPTPTTFKETTTWTWNRTGRAKMPEDISPKHGWPDGKLA